MKSLSAPPTPPSPDGFTFPSDAAVKRIDLMFAGTPSGAGLCGPRAPPAAGCVLVDNVWVMGADPLPATEGSEGRGLGMNHEYSPIYASDHRVRPLPLTLVSAHALFCARARSPNPQPETPLSFRRRRSWRSLGFLWVPRVLGRSSKTPYV